MSQMMTVSEPTQAEHAQSEADFMRQFSAPAPGPTPAPDRNAAPTWGLPRINPALGGWADSTAHLGIAPRDGTLKLTLTAETAASGTHVLVARRQAVAEANYAESHARVLSSDEYTRASGILPLAAAAERRLAAANVKLDALASRKARLVARPTPTLGKALVELDAESLALTREVAEHRAEVEALAGAAGDARQNLLQAARQHCRDVRNDGHEAGTQRLAQLLGAFFASHSDELTQIAVASSVRSPERPADAVALVKMLEDDLVAAPE